MSFIFRPRLVVAGCVVLSTLGTSAGLAQSSANATKGSPDTAFIKKAAMGGIAEVELGKLAQQQAANDQVKQFGARMVKDHSKANDQLKQIASDKGVEVPASPAAKEQHVMKKMQAMPG